MKCKLCGSQMTLLISPNGMFESCDKCGHTVEFDWTKLGRKYEGRRVDEITIDEGFLNDYKMAKENTKMKFVAKEKPEVKLELGDVVEYVSSMKDTTVRAIVIEAYGGNGRVGYSLLNLENFKIMGVAESHTNLKDVYNVLKDRKDFRIIKSSNLELREV